MTRHADFEQRVERVATLMRQHDEVYTRDLANEAGLPIAWLYPVLARLQAQGAITSRFVDGSSPRSRVFRWVRP
jgi:hypothetical protein